MTPALLGESVMCSNGIVTAAVRKATELLLLLLLLRKPPLIRCVTMREGLSDTTPPSSSSSLGGDLPGSRSLLLGRFRQDRRCSSTSIAPRRYSSSASPSAAAAGPTFPSIEQNLRPTHE
jgi:hypothetical protein